MVKHNNPTIAQDSVRLFNFKTGDGLSEINDTIVPIIPIEPRCDIIKSASATNATSAVIYNTPADKDFYITAMSLSLIKDVTSTSASSTIAMYIDGVQTFTLGITSITLTVQSETISISLPNPIKVDRGTAITVTNTTNVANINTRGTVYGYLVETVKGV